MDIVVGDDNSDAVVKVFTNATVKPTDRLIKLTAVVHSENGRLVLYGGNGPSPYFDPQGVGGGLSVASVGTVAYAATLSDSGAAGEESQGGYSIMSVSSPTTSDGSWVYLTGQIVNYVGTYYSYAIPTPGWVNVYYIQGLDRTSGIRVWTANSSVSAGYVVDVMAKLDTKDGQRLLGIIDTTYPYDYSSVECKVLSTNTSNRTVPVGMNNRDLGGSTIGNNLGITDGYGLYNIGSYVTVWGKVLEKGTYQFAQSSYGNTKPYIRIDDGSGVLSGNCTPSYGGPYGSDGVTVFGINGYSYYTQVTVGDYISVTGVSSVWKPNGSTDTYRSIWTSNYAVNQTATPTTRQVYNTGTITGTVKLYDMPDAEAKVQVFCTSGHSAILTVTRGTDGSGSATYSFNSIPRTVIVGGYYNYPTYAVSVKCEGFKTRTYTAISPGTGSGTVRNIYVVPLRKIYATASTFSLSACSGQPSTITATVRDADHNPVQGVTVRFKTDRGSFDSGSVVRTATATTAADGTATAALYPVLASGEYGYAAVQVTDDSAPLTGDNANDDPYKFDWEPVLSSSGYNINISSPTYSLQLQPSSITGLVCEDQKTVTAQLTMCSNPRAGETVTFTTSNGTFLESGTRTLQVTTNSAGQATATVVRAEACKASTASVSATSTVAGLTAYSNTVAVTWKTWKLKVTASPDWVVSGNAANAKAKLTLDDGTTPVANQSVTLSTDQGVFANSQTTYTANTDANGEISTTLTVSNCPVTATVTGTTIALPCNCSFTASDTVLVVCSENDAKTLIVAIDWTGSMNSGRDAMTGLNQLMQDLKASGKALKVGGVKFSDYIKTNTQTITYILSPTSDYDAVIAWINSITGAENGGDTNENGLEALKKASEIGPGGYIALATDAGFHYWGDNEDANSNQHSPDNGNGTNGDCTFTNLTALQAHDILVAAGCKVYIDTGGGSGSDSTAASDYSNAQLYVNGAMEDTSYNTYTFPKLKVVLGQ